MNKDNLVAVDSQEAAELLLEKKDQIAHTKERKVEQKMKPVIGQMVVVAGNPKAPWYGQKGKVVSVAQAQSDMTTSVEFTLLGRAVFATFDCRILEVIGDQK